MTKLLALRVRILVETNKHDHDEELELGDNETLQEFAERVRRRTLELAIRD